MRLAATFQSTPGPLVLANYVAANALIQPSLGRPLSGGAANVTVKWFDPGQMFRDRITELDLHVGKVLRFGRTRTNVGVDVFNALNSSVVQNSNATFGTNWLRPTLVMPARFVKVSMQLDF